MPTDKPYTHDVMRRLRKAVAAHRTETAGRLEDATLVLNLYTYLKVKEEWNMSPGDDDFMLGGFKVQAGTPMNKDHLLWYVVL